MAPEQAAGRTADLDRRADVYALGAILYEMLTGRPPFRGKSISETLWQVQNEEPLSPRQVVPAVDRDLEIICLKCLEKEPALRFASALDLADELERYLNEEPILTRRVGWFERGLKWVRRRPAVAAAWALAVLVTVIGSAGGFAGWQWLQAEAARKQADEARQQAEEARQQAVEANADLEKQKRLADEARGWALKDRLKFEQAMEKAREPATILEAKLRRELEEARKQFSRPFYFRQIDLAHRHWQSGQTVQAQRVLAACSTENVGWEYHYVDRLCHGAALPLPAGVVGPFTHLAFSPDGTRLATTGRGGVTVWDFPARTNRLAIPHLAPWVQFSPDGKWLVIPHEKGVKLFDARTGKEHREMADLAAGHVEQAAFRPGGPHLAIIEWGSEAVAVIDFATGKRAFTLLGHRGGARAVAYSPDGKWLATATDDRLRLWDAATGKEARTISAGIAGHRHPLAFSPDSQRIACIDWRFIGAWDVADGKRVAHVNGGQRLIRCAAFTAEGDLVSGGSDTTGRTWDMKTGRPLRTFRGLPAQVESIIVNPKDGSILAWDRAGNAALWGPADHQEVRVLPHQAAVTGVAFHPDSKDVVTVTQKGLRVIDPATGKEGGAYVSGLGGWNRVAYGGKGRWLASGGDNGVVVHDTKAGREAWKEKGRASAIAFSPDGSRLVVAGERLTVRDAATGKELFRCADYSGNGVAVAFAPDGSKFAVAEPRDVMVYDPRDGKRLGGYPVGGAQSLAFSPDGNQLAAATGDRAVIWSQKTGIVTHQLPHVSLVSAVAFSPDGRRLATGGWDQTVQVWDVATGQLALTLSAPDSIITALAFSGDSRWLAGAGTDGAARVWDAGPPVRR